MHNCWTLGYCVCGAGPEHPAIERVAADASDADALSRLADRVAVIYSYAGLTYLRWVTDWPRSAADENVSPADRHTKSARPHITVGAQPNDVTDCARDSAIVMIFNVSGR